MTAFVRAHLVKTTSFGSGETKRALSETAVQFNETDWFWTDDNAKAAELLCEPANYAADPATAEAAIDFVLRMSQGAVIQRRGGLPELRVISADPAAFRVETAFFIVEGDLTRGILRHALRFNDNRTVTAAQHSGNTVAFRLDGRAVALRVEDAVCATAVQVEERAVVLSYTGALHRRAGFGRTRFGPELGRVTYAYKIDADRPSMALTVSLAPAPRVALADVALTTALDGLGGLLGVRYRALALRAGSSERVARPAGARRTILHEGAADYSAVVQEGGSPGFNYALHVLMRDGGKLGRIVGVSRRGGRLHSVVNRYHLGAVSGGEVCSIREERMLTGGGYYDVLAHYADVMQRGAGGGASDPSMSYDLGAELNAVAVHLLFARRGRYAATPSPERLAMLTAWYDRHIERYFAFVQPDRSDALRRVFTRGIAFVILSLDCMIRAGGEARYRALLRTAVVLVLRLGRRSRLPGRQDEVVFADAWAPRGCFLDCHAACLLALARASRHGDPGGAIGRAIHAGIAGIRLYTGPAVLSATHREPYEGLAVTQWRVWDTHVDTGFWTFKIGLVLRALHATRRAAEAGTILMSRNEAQRLQARVERAERQIAASCRWHGDALEVLTSRIAGEGNSETQPWVALGLVPVVDEQIELLEPPLVSGPSRPVV